MNKGSKILIVTVIASLFLLTTTVFAAPARSVNAKTDLMTDLHTKAPLGKFIEVGRVTAYVPGASITVETRDGRSVTFDLVKQATILPNGAHLGVDSRVIIFGMRDRGVRGFTAFSIVDLSPAKAAASTSSKTPAATAAPAASPTPTPAK